MRSRVLAAIALTAVCGASGGSAVLAGRETPASAAVVESVTFKAEGDGLSVYLKTSVPVPRFQCAFPSGSAREVVVVVPGAVSRLESAYDPGGPLVKAARVEAEPDGVPGVRVRFVLGEGTLSAVEQTDQGVILRFQRVIPPVLVPDPSRAPEYKVGVGDKLEIMVFGHDDLTKIVEVRGDGSINYPLIGTLTVSGKSVAQIDDELTTVLAKDYLVDPQVSVDVREYQSQWVTIIGEVRTPGRYVLKRNMRLIDLLAEAGGGTKDAGADILITRRAEGDGAAQQMVVDLGHLLSRDNQEANIPLSHGDIVTLGTKQVFYIRGEVAHPASYFLESGMTVLKAISVAGGFGQFANRKEVELLRTGANGIQEKMVINIRAIENGKKEDVPILANDTIIVPRRIF